MNVEQIWAEQIESTERYIETPIYELNELKCCLVTNNILSENYFLVSCPTPFLKIFKDRELLSKGVRVFHIDKGEQGDLLLYLQNPELKDIFILFIQNVINGISGKTAEVEVIKEIFAIIERWKKLFEKFSQNRLSREMEKGLIGELFFIYLSLEKNVNERVVIESWDGPTFNDKDFLFPSGDVIEIKLTEAKNPVLKITSERQLDSTNYQRLFVVLFAVEPNTHGDLSLVKLIEAIRNKLESPEVRMIFNGKLAEIGYLDHDREQYKLIYSIKNTWYFNATSDQFPKIVNNQVAAGIFNISYSIDMLALKDYIIQTETFYEDVKLWKEPLKNI